MRGTLITVLAVVLVLSVTFILIYRHLESNIVQVEFDPTDRPDVVETDGPAEPMNLLIIGSDSRDGDNAVIGGDTPGLSDVVMLLHVSADREFAYGVSLPRDAMVQAPACKSKDGAQTHPAGLRMFNTAFALGGPACTVKMVEHLTDIRIDHFAVVDFVGFKTMVDAINGITMCVPHEVNDTIGKIHLPGGTYKMTGAQVLDYARLRHGLGAPTGDIGRMKRQQAVVAAMINRVMSAGTLANPVRLFNFLDAATESLTTDPGLADLRRMVSLGSSLKDIGMDQIQFITVPWQPYEPDPNRLAWAPEADELWEAIKFDRVLPKKFLGEAISPIHEELNAPGDKQPGGKPPAKTPPGSGTDPQPGSKDPGADPELDPEEAERIRAAEAAGLCV